ncbi:hypothetical protein [Microbacterium candidum]|uniref:DUF2244 domain-containing protein n=1 Tax=Microbacterium candidum TaxID=3041922 RepID=A0ABT7N4E8_9MICO|nr:hypothetical protein [Microbacterium sp. ASV49]MDL9981573.1 hypothetical protein [Microbacterium sp. ASV49]
MSGRRRIPLAPIGSAVAIALPASVFLWFVGISVASTLAFAVTVVAIGVAWAGFAGSRAPAAPRMRATPRPGVRTDVARLSWALRGRDGQVSEPGERRVRAFARTRLLRFGLDLDDPADGVRIRSLIGDGPYALLVGSGGARPSLSSIERCLDALDAVGPGPAGGPSVVSGAAAGIPASSSPRDSEGHPAP